MNQVSSKTEILAAASGSVLGDPNGRQIAPNSAIPPALSLYLDLVRFAAAFAVFLSHITQNPFTNDLLSWRVGTYGDIAVTIFFALSGYVIGYVTDTREKTAAQYYSARLARFYSVALPALLLTFLLDSLGASINPDFYAIKKILWKPVSWSGYISSLFFVNEYQILNLHGVSPGTNGPYWSMSFEASYYLIAGIILYCPKRLSLLLAAGVLFFAGRTITALFPIWIAGYACYRLRHSFTFSRRISIFLFILTLLAIVFLPPIIARLPDENFGFFFPWARKPFNRNLIADYVASTVFLLHLIGATSLFRNIDVRSSWMVKPIRYLGQLTFPLYLFHYPILCFLGAISPFPNTTVSNLIFIGFPSLAFIWIATPYCDTLRNNVRTKLLKLWPMPKRTSKI